jgi:hypothetical protein
VSGAAVDFSAFGGGVVSSVNTAGTWTATYTLVAGTVDAASRNVGVTATDDAGNSTTIADTSHATVDAATPIITSANIIVTGATGTGGAFRIGDTVTVAWRDATAGGDYNADTSGVTADLSQMGGGSATSTVNASGVWTATFTPPADSIDATNLNVSVTATDDAGNRTTRSGASTITIDTHRPAVTSVVLPAAASYGIGQNLDFTVPHGEPVLVSTATGTPRLVLTVGSATRYASYHAGRARRRSSSATPYRQATTVRPASRCHRRWMGTAARCKMLPETMRTFCSVRRAVLPGYSSMALLRRSSESPSRRRARTTSRAS